MIRSGFGEECQVGLGDDAGVLHRFLELIGISMDLRLVNILPIGENGDLIRVARRLQDLVTGAAKACARWGRMIEDLAKSRIILNLYW